MQRLLIQAAGVELKELVHEESVTFYVSPFTRSKQTYDHIRKAFHDEQVNMITAQNRELIIRRFYIPVCVPAGAACENRPSDTRARVGQLPGPFQNAQYYS